MNKIEYNVPTKKIDGKENDKDKILMKHGKKVEADKMSIKCWQPIAVTV